MAPTDVEPNNSSKKPGKGGKPLRQPKVLSNTQQPPPAIPLQPSGGGYGLVTQQPLHYLVQSHGHAGHTPERGHDTRGGGAIHVIIRIIWRHFT